MYACVLLMCMYVYVRVYLFACVFCVHDNVCVYVVLWVCIRI